MDVLDQPNLAGAVAAGIDELTPELARKRRSQLRIIFDRFVRNRVAVMGMIVLAIVILLTVFAPVITHKTATFDPANTIPTHPIAFAHASLQHLLGTDELGRDVFARLLFGAQVSLLVATSRRRANTSRPSSSVPSRCCSDACANAIGCVGMVLAGSKVAVMCSRASSSGLRSHCWWPRRGGART